MIVVTGAGGMTGSAVVRALRHRGRAVRALVGSARPRPELAGLGAQVVVADLEDPSGVEPLLTGAEALYLIWPNFDPGESDGATALLRAARRAGVARVVYHSVLRPQARSMPHHAAKDRAEEALDSSGLRSWRVLQPCSYADNLDGQLAAVRTSGVLRSYWGLRRAQSLVDLRDVAAADAGARPFGLLRADQDELGRGGAVAGQVAVDPGGGGVAGLSAVDEDDGPAGPGQRHRGAEPGRAPADHDGVVVVRVLVLRHARSIGAAPSCSKTSCDSGKSQAPSRCDRSPWWSRIVRISAVPPTPTTLCGVRVLNDAASPAATTCSRPPRTSRTVPDRT